MGTIAAYGSGIQDAELIEYKTLTLKGNMTMSNIITDAMKKPHGYIMDGAHKVSETSKKATSKITRKHVIIGAGVAVGVAVGAATIYATRNPAMAAKAADATRVALTGDKAVKVAKAAGGAVRSHVSFSAGWGTVMGTVFTFFDEKKTAKGWSGHVVEETVRVGKNPWIIITSVGDGLRVFGPVASGTAYVIALTGAVADLVIASRRLRKTETFVASDVEADKDAERDDRWIVDKSGAKMMNPDFDWASYYDAHSNTIWDKYFAEAVENAEEGIFSKDLVDSKDWAKATTEEMVQVAGHYAFHNVSKKRNANSLFITVLDDFDAYKEGPFYAQANEFANLVANAHRTQQRVKKSA